MYISKRKLKKWKTTDFSFELMLWRSLNDNPVHSKADTPKFLRLAVPPPDPAPEMLADVLPWSSQNLVILNNQASLCHRRGDKRD